MKDLQMKGLTEKIEMLLKGLDKSKRQELVRRATDTRTADANTDRRACHPLADSYPFPLSLPPLPSPLPLPSVQDLAEIGSRLRDFQTALDGAQLELKHLKAHLQKAEFTKILRDHKHTMKELKGEYEWRKMNSDKNELMDGAKPAASGSDFGTADGLMKHGLEVQDQSKQSLDRTLRVVHETKDIGIDTVAKLEANSQQIEAIYGETDT